MTKEYPDGKNECAECRGQESEGAGGGGRMEKKGGGGEVSVEGVCGPEGLGEEEAEGLGT